MKGQYRKTIENIYARQRIEKSVKELDKGKEKEKESESGDLQCNYLDFLTSFHSESPYTINSLF